MKFIISNFCGEPKQKKGSETCEIYHLGENKKKKVRPVKFIILIFGGEPKPKKEAQPVKFIISLFGGEWKTKNGNETSEIYHLEFLRGTKT